MLAAVNQAWAPQADRVEHLPIGFGAHHWAASHGPDRLLFVTFDGLEPRHTAASLESAYRGAACLAAQGLEFVLASVPATTGTFTVPLADGALSATPWRDGGSAANPHSDASKAAESARMLARLHARTPPPDIPRWEPLVPPDFAIALDRRTATAWRSGPYGERARLALRERLVDIGRWSATYHLLAAEPDPRTWVATHGEPHAGNMIRTGDGPLLIDWESLKLAPRERDFATLLETGLEWLSIYGPEEPDWHMVELFDLEWRLDEISSYADWLYAPHPGIESDKVAIEGLLEELTRSEWQHPG